MRPEIEFFKENIDKHHWERFRKSAVQNIVHNLNDAVENNNNSMEDNTELVGTALICYQKLRRLNEEAINQYLERDNYEKAIKNLEEKMNNLKRDVFPLFLHHSTVQKSIVDGRKSLNAMINCGLLQSLIDYKFEIDKDLMNMINGEETDSDELPTPAEVKHNLNQYVFQKAACDFFQLLTNLDCYGLQLAYMQEKKITGVNKDDWELFWNGVSILNKALPSVLMTEIFPPIISTFREDLYDVNPILDHVTNSLYNTSLEKAYLKQKQDKEIMEEVEGEVDWLEQQKEEDEEYKEFLRRYRNGELDDEDDDDEGDEWKKT